MEEEKRPGEYLEMYEDDHGSYIMNSKDLCLMPKFDKVLSAGFDSLKIEGRHKTPYYVAQTARVYRKAIDDYFNAPAAWKPDLYIQELETLQNRGYTLGFFDGIPTSEAQDYLDTSSRSDWRNVGYVKENRGNSIVIDIRNKITKGDKIEILSPYQFEPEIITIDSLIDGFDDKPADFVGPGRTGQTAIIPIDPQKAKLFPELTIIRMKI